MTKTNSKSQKGRSMVEMLGVLAIIGVLSVGGVYGYGVAMKKHKANQLLHEASMLATTISAQAMTNDGKLPETITNFGSASNGTFETTVGESADKTQFILTISGLDDGVCEQLQNLQGGMMRETICSGTTATLSYYKNLATSKEEGEKSPTGGSKVDLDENGCYEVSYKGGLCCDIDKTVKVCPGDEEPDTSCTQNPPSTCSCDTADSVGKDGENWYCYYDEYWQCWGYQCSDGPLAGQCVSKCSCYIPEGEDGWKCNEETGEAYCPNGVCTVGAYAGKCMKLCCTEPSPGDLAECTSSGEWVCWPGLCAAGENKGKCVKPCPCDNSEKPGEGWMCDGGSGRWLCPTGECSEGPDEGKCTNECRCNEGCTNCDQYTGECLD